jgi:DNA-directed RNA polymerase specialized sigma24 family protein
VSIFGWFRKIFRKKVSENQALISDSSAYKRLQAFEDLAKPVETKAEQAQITAEELKPSTVEIQKESLQLGVAAGYFGRSIRHIESALNRIETMMVTKDWMASQAKDMTQILEILRKHEENEQKRFEIMQNILLSMQKTAKTLPYPQKEEILTQIKELEAQFPLTPKMEQILEILRETKQMSYEELSQRLGITKSGLRSLLTSMAKRTNKIKRFSKSGKGWVKYVED